jgi:hypothetical protein
VSDRVHKVCTRSLTPARIETLLAGAWRRGAARD